MESQVFLPAAFSPDASYYLPPDEPLPEEDDMQRREYSRQAKRLDTDDLMVMVGEAFSNSEVLRSIIEDLKAHPFFPGERRHLHISDNMKLGDEIARMADTAMGDVIAILQAMEGR